MEAQSSDGQTARQRLEVGVIARPVLAPEEFCTAYPTYGTPTFVDAALEGAVRVEMSLSADDAITCGRIADYGKLQADRLGITSLVGLQNMTGMQRLDLQQNAITDIGPLAGLTDLLVLELQDNSITSLSPLSGLPALFFLDVDGNSISDLEPLRGLTTPEGIEASNNSISSLEPLRALTGLDGFESTDNSIREVEPSMGSKLKSSWRAGSSAP